MTILRFCIGIALLAALGGGAAAWAQDAPAKPGTLHGLVVDAETGEAMIGVAVMLDGTRCV